MDPKMDQLAYVSGFVDCIEINSTFYRRRSSGTRSRGWTGRRASRNLFTAKLHQSFTHEGKIDAAVVKQFHQGFAPMLETEKLKHLLVQFRYDFADNAATREHLAKIVQPFKDAFSLIWSCGINPGNVRTPWIFCKTLESACAISITPCHGNRSLAALHGRERVTFACTDATRRSGSARPAGTRYTLPLQSAGACDNQGAARQPGKGFESLTVIANNHYRGAELANALELKTLVSGQKQPVPEGLLKTYPNLAKIALTE